MGSRQFLKLCSRQRNGRRSEMPRKWQVQLGPNFIKHNPICALILPKRLAADAALPDEKGRKKKKGKKEEEESQEACGSFSKLLSVQLSFPFSLLLYVTKFVVHISRVYRLRNFRFEEDIFDTD